MRYNPRYSIFAGMPNDQLQCALNAAQAAYVELLSGSKVVTASYTQGNGVKSVTYTAAEIGNVVALIEQLQAQLGIIRRPRRPITVGYR